MSPNYLLKIVTVGSGSVGKTSMIVRYSSGVFREHYSPTLGTGFAYKKMELEKDKVKHRRAENLLTDIVSLVRYGLGQSKTLIAFEEVVDERFEAWLKQQEMAGNIFDSEQIEWLTMIKNHIARSVTPSSASS